MPNLSWTLLAQAAPSDDLEVVTESLRGIRHSGWDLAILLVAIGGLVLLLVSWALWVRKRRKHRSNWHLHHHHQHPASSNGDGEDDEARPRRRRHRRREHRPRNPTLAETGGLPPPREEGHPDSLP